MKTESRISAVLITKLSVQDILKFDSAVRDYGEYHDYENSPTKSNASEFTNAFIERNADRIGELGKLVSYMAERPGVEKLGAHGLFSQSDDKEDYGCRTLSKF